MLQVEVSYSICYIYRTFSDLCSRPIVNALLNFNMAKMFKVLLTEQKSIVILHDINSIHQDSKSPSLFALNVMI